MPIKQNCTLQRKNTLEYFFSSVQHSPRAQIVKQAGSDKVAAQLENALKDNAMSDRVTLWLFFALCIAILAAFIGLIPLGHWEDEWGEFSNFQDNGHYFFTRLWHWSPRPLSESLIFVYISAVDLLQRPLIGIVLSVAWSFLILALFLPPFLYRDTPHPAKTAVMPAICVSLSLFCTFLLGRTVNQMFYWPMAALAYIPALAAVTFLFWVFITEHSTLKHRQFACTLAMTTAAVSCEIGALFVMVFFLTIFVARMLLKRWDISFKKSVYEPVTLWRLLPLGFAMSVLISVYFSRVKPQADTYGDPLIAHHFIHSLMLAIQSFIKIMLSVDEQNLTWRTVSAGIIQKALFFLGCYGALLNVIREAAPRTVHYLFALAFACFATSFLTVLAAFYQFGLESLDRQITMQHCLNFVGLACAAGCAACVKVHVSDLVLCPILPKLYTGCLMLSLLMPVVQIAPRLLSDYQNYKVLHSIKTLNWNAGKAPGDSMLYRQVSIGRVVWAIEHPQGIYTLDSKSYVFGGMLRLFHKKSITVEAPTP